MVHVCKNTLEPKMAAIPMYEFWDVLNFEKINAISIQLLGLAYELRLTCVTHTSNDSCHGILMPLCDICVECKIWQAK